MELFWDINNYINGIVWGAPMVILISAVGIFLTVGIKFITWRELPSSLKKLFSKQEEKKSGISPRAALFTALSATVGTGNIAGVATAIYIGGPGAIFYMWLVALIGMATKYAEALLAVKYRQKDEEGKNYGGAMYYISLGIGEKSPIIGKILGLFFAIAVAFAAFGVGSGIQTHSIAEAYNNSFNIPHAASGILIAVLAGVVILGGIKRIANVAETLVPTMIALYIGCGIIILIIFAENIPSAFVSIFSHAFGFEAVVGGGVGAAILQGFRRGIFSNEAGLGSASIAHAASSEKNPVKQGKIAMLGVFIDTIVVCTFTALIILASGVYTPGNEISGAVLTQNSFAAAIPHGDKIVAVALSIFAFTTILGWSYYGEQAVRYITPSKNIRYAYRVFYVLIAVAVVHVDLSDIWSIADTLNGLMALPNLIALLVLLPLIVKLTNEYQEKK